MWSTFSRDTLGLWFLTPFLTVLLWWSFSWATSAQRARRKSPTPWPQPDSAPTILDDPKKVKELYHQLHYLEDFPDAALIAKDVLRQALDRAVSASSSSTSKNRIHSILGVADYSRVSLIAWVRERDLTSTQNFHAYTARRAAGGPRVLFETRSEAKKYLQAQAPLRYVDGAWLGRLSRARAPWKDQRTLQLLWQILSEELGDGDLAKHHTHIYHDLLLSLEPRMPAGHSKEFLETRWGADNDSVWRSALVQLIISLFQEDFLPEILGFNLHFEGITPNMMIASVETRELGLDPAYFLLHISIDNAHSGHTAMAMDAVCDYIEQCRREEGPHMAERAWRRVQAGYLLSEGRWNSCKQAGAVSAASENESKVADLFARKAEAGCELHCTSKTVVGGRRVMEWLKPESMADPRWRMALVRYLGQSRYWVTPGKSSSSRFMRELLWPGRMFGAFTDHECQLVERWIQELPMSCDGAYLAFIGTEQQDAIASGLNDRKSISNTPDFQRILLSGEDGDFQDTGNQTSDGSNGTLDATAIVNSPFLPLIWFAHLCLLEGFTAVPSRNANPDAQSAIRMLRAQNGLGQPTHSVIGNSNYEGNTGCQENSTLIDIGLQLLASRGLLATRSLAEILETYPSNSLADLILDISTAPNMCPAVVLGMASSFALLYRAVAQSTLLDAACRRQLLDVAAVHDREAAWSLREHEDETMYARSFLKGAAYVREGLRQMAGAR